MAKTAIKKEADTRLDTESWIRLALELLATSGIDGVRVEPLARRLNVTKGSFYWHFRDRDALCEAMLMHWRRHATIDIIDRLEASQEAADVRLQRLLRLPFATASGQGAQVELSIRLWARTDPRAAATLKEIDQLRLRYIAKLLEACGFSSSQSSARAILAYSYMRVATNLIPNERTELMADCENILLKGT